MVEWDRKQKGVLEMNSVEGVRTLPRRQEVGIQGRRRHHDLCKCIEIRSEFRPQNCLP